MPVLVELNKKADIADTIKEETLEQPLAPPMIDLIMQQKLS